MSDRIFNFNEGCHVTFTDIHDNNNITILCDVGKIEMSANNVVIPQPGSTTNVGCDQRESKFETYLPSKDVKQLQADNENKQPNQIQ